MKTKLVVLILVLIAIISAGFRYKIFQNKFDYKNQELNTNNFNIIDLNINEKYYTNSELPIDINRDDLKNDFNNVAKLSYLPIKNYKYNPVTTSHIILSLLESYRKNQDKAYLKKAKIYTDGLIRSGIYYQNGLYFPYNFNYQTHTTKDKLKNPWFSGMAQGQVLSVLTRIYLVTKENKYKRAADQVFISLTNIRSDKTKIWVSLIDKNNYYWIEEYPQERPDYTLNGFLYAVIGLYDYYEIEKNSDTEKYLKAAIHTAKNYIPRYRNQHGISFYCLKHKSKNTKYHTTHIRQIEFFYKITNDTFFKDMAEQLKYDYQ